MFIYTFYIFCKSRWPELSRKISSLLFIFIMLKNFKFPGIEWLLSIQEKDFRISQFLWPGITTRGVFPISTKVRNAYKSLEHNYFFIPYYGYLFTKKNGNKKAKRSQKIDFIYRYEARLLCNICISCLIQVYFSSSFPYD